MTIEGIEGAGKTTMARRIGDWFNHLHRPSLCAREPGSTPTGEAIRSLLLSPGIALSPESEMLLFEAARLQLMDDLLLPALEQYYAVILDRFIDSTLAYQGYGRGVDLNWIAALNQFASRGRKPDVTLLLDVDPKIGLDRARTFSQANGQVDRFEAETIEFMQRVREGFLQIAGNEPSRFVTIAVKDTIEETWGDILKILEKRFL